MGDSRPENFVGFPRAYPSGQGVDPADKYFCEEYIGAGTMMPWTPVRGHDIQLL